MTTCSFANQMSLSVWHFSSEYQTGHDIWWQSVTLRWWSSWHLDNDHISCLFAHQMSVSVWHFSSECQTGHDMWWECVTFTWWSSWYYGVRDIQIMTTYRVYLQIKSQCLSDTSFLNIRQDMPFDESSWHPDNWGHEVWILMTYRVHVEINVVHTKSFLESSGYRTRLLKTSRFQPGSLKLVRIKRYFSSELMVQIK